MEEFHFCLTDAVDEIARLRETVDEQGSKIDTLEDQWRDHECPPCEHE